jgi:hypothetical protein
LKLDFTHHILIYVDDDNILGLSVHTLKKNTDASLTASKEIGLDVSSEKSKFMVMSGDHNARHIYKIKRRVKSFEIVKQFRYLGTTLTGQNYFH